MKFRRRKRASTAGYWGRSSGVRTDGMNVRDHKVTVISSQQAVIGGKTTRSVSKSATPPGQSYRNCVARRLKRHHTSPSSSYRSTFAVTLVAVRPQSLRFESCQALLVQEMTSRRSSGFAQPFLAAEESLYHHASQKTGVGYLPDCCSLEITIIVNHKQPRHDMAEQLPGSFFLHWIQWQFFRWSRLIFITYFSKWCSVFFECLSTLLSLGRRASISLLKDHRYLCFLLNTNFIEFIAGFWSVIPSGTSNGKLSTSISEISPQPRVP